MTARAVPTCTLLTDFGWRDYYVAAVKGVLATRAPAARILDIAHDVAPGDVEAGAWLLAAAARWFPAGTVHLAVVDPGVGSERRLLAVRAGGHSFVGPDNGLLLPAAETASRLGGQAPEVRSVERQDLWLEGPGDTFHGRDRFAPTAAALLDAEPFEDLGPVLDQPVRLDLPEPTREDSADATETVLRGRVAHVDRFGNLVTDLPAAWLTPAGERAKTRIEVRGEAVERHARRYAEIPLREPAWLIGSLGTLELSLRGESLAERWDLQRGAAVVVRSRRDRGLE